MATATETEVRERPILFRPELVRAILDNKKTMTRRVVKLPAQWSFPPARFVNGYIYRWGGSISAHGDSPERIECPYGKPGDLLWVRETWQRVYATDDGQRFTYETDKTRREFIEYAATVKDGESPPRWRSPIHMPKWAVRLWLEVTAVRVEQLNDISEADATAEGIRSWTKDGHLYKHGHIEPGDKGATPWTDMHRNSRDAFCGLWESINGNGSWARNDWVWCISFRRKG